MKFDKFCIDCKKRHEACWDTCPAFHLHKAEVAKVAKNRREYLDQKDLEYKRRENKRAFIKDRR